MPSTRLCHCMLFSAPSQAVHSGAHHHSPVSMMFVPCLLARSKQSEVRWRQEMEQWAGGAGELGVYVQEELNVVSLVTCSDLLHYSTMRAAPDFKVSSSP